MCAQKLLLLISLLYLDGSFPTIECDYDEQTYDDYLQQIKGCNKLRDMRIDQDSTKCFNQSIIDDLRLENTEYTGLALHLTDYSAFTEVTEEHAIIEILDNDGEFISIHVESLGGIYVGD